MQRHEAVSKAIDQIKDVTSNSYLFILLDSKQEEEGWYLQIGFLTFYLEEAIIDSPYHSLDLSGEPCEYHVWTGIFEFSTESFQAIMHNYDPENHPWW